MVLVVVAGSVIIVDGATIGVAVRDDEIIIDLSLRRHVRGHARGDGGQVSLPVPGVDGAVVAALAAGVKQEIRFDVVAAAETVVDVVTGPWDLEADVVHQCGLGCFGLEPAGRLLFVDAQVVDEVRIDDCPPREIALGAVRTGAGRLVRVGAGGEA